MAAPPSDPTVPVPSSSGPLPANDAAPSSGRAVSAVDEEGPPPSAVTAGRVRVALRAFLASRKKNEGDDFIRGVIHRKLGTDLDPALLEDLMYQAHLDALEAKSPPWTVGGIRGWVFRVTRRAIAHYFEARKADDENLDPEGVAADQFDRHAPSTDVGAREHLICKWLAKHVGDDPVRRDTMQVMLEKEVAGRSLGELAAERGTTVSALSNRIHKLRKELAPKATLMDREKPRLFILGALWLCGLGAFVAAVVVVWGLLFPAPPPPPPRPVLPVPSASAAPAPAPTFDQAFPTQPDAGPEKPERLKP
jgi:DNA-directed RNA polymerase specialized sigma24 family protein